MEQLAAADMSWIDATGLIDSHPASPHTQRVAATDQPGDTAGVVLAPVVAVDEISEHTVAIPSRHSRAPR